MGIKRACKLDAEGKKNTKEEKRVRAARRSQTAKVEGTKMGKKKKKKSLAGLVGRGVRCSWFLLWAAEVREEKFLSHGDGIRNVNRLSQSRAGTVCNQRLSTLTEGHARFWDCC